MSVLESNYSLSDFQSLFATYILRRVLYDEWLYKQSQNVSTLYDREPPDHHHHHQSSHNHISEHVSIFWFIIAYLWLYQCQVLHVEW